MEICSRPSSFASEFALPSDLLDDLTVDSGYSTAVQSPDTEEAGSSLDCPFSFSYIIQRLSPLTLQKWLPPAADLTQAHLSTGLLPHFAETECRFYIEGCPPSLTDSELSTVSSHVVSPAGLQYPVIISRDDNYQPRLSCLYRPLELGQHTAFLLLDNKVHTSLSIVVARNYSQIRSRPTVAVDIEFVESTGKHQVRKPWGISCNTKTEQVLIADRQKHEVLVYGADGDFHFSFGSSGHLPGQFNRPIAVAYDCAADRILVADKDNHRIQMFTSSGVFVSSFGTRGRRPGQLHFPWDVAVSPNGQLIAVADSRNGRVQLFDSNGYFIRQHQGPLKYPRGVAFDNKGENLFVTDFNLHCIFKLDINFSSCQLLVNETLLLRPSGLDVDIAGNLVVCDSRNNSIKVFCSSSGNLLHDIRRIGNNNFELPLDVAVMRAGYIAVLDLNGRVRIF